MTDFFALLGVARRPRLDLEQLKSRFHTLSAEFHPDRLHAASEAERQAAAQHYTLLNEAQQSLREPKARLHHLVLLERGRKPGDTNSLPESLLTLFAQIGPLLREADALLKQKASASSAVERALASARALPCLERIGTLRTELDAHRQRLEQALAALDADWTDNPVAESVLDRAEQLYHQFGFLDRWAGQLREREFELTV